MSSPSKLMELNEEVEGDQIGSKNYRFHRIGEPVSIKHPPDSQFDSDSPPSQPLAISDRFRLLFAAHSQGFCVARIKEVKELAEKLKNNESKGSIQELSIVDVPAGKVSILAVSFDDSMLAATVENCIHFYAVSSLLHKEQKPSYSVSVVDSSYIIDLRWAQHSVKEYIVLSHNGKLYQGSGQSPLKDIMDNVDAVEWSEQGHSVAVGRKNVLSIFSSQFKEKRSVLMSFKSVIGDSDGNSVIKVNCIRWVRSDCIMVGCLQLNDEGEEENYLVQVITSKGGRIDDASSIPIVLSFYDIFLDYQVDIVPRASGSHLLLQYFGRQQLAFVANRKNVTQHVILFGWGLSEKMNEAAVIDILNDAWIPQIELQGNGDENIILGLSIHKLFENGNVTYLLGEEETEVPPCCNLLCLTIDGKLSVFDFASAADTSDSVEISDLSREDSAATLEVPSRQGSAEISSTGSDEREADTSARVGPHISSRNELLDREVAKTTILDQFSSPSENKPLQYDQPLKGYKEQTSTQIAKAQNRDTQQTSYAGLQVKSAEQVSLKSSNLVNLEPEAQGHSKSNVETISEAKFSTGFFARDVLKDGTNPATSKMFQIGRTTELPNSMVTTEARSKPLFSSSSAIASPQQDPSYLKKFVNSSVNSSGQFPIPGAVNIQQSAAFNSTQVPVQQNSDSGKFFTNPQKKVPILSSTLVQSSEANSLKQYRNIEEMVKKLDSLLENIEGKGGFVDASIACQESSVVDLEEKIRVVSRRCREWKVNVDEQISEMQDLLDKTVQVLSRKIYMEGIFKQARDTRYWDLWNRQKLSSELELKRRHIVEANKELTNQLIELERHFNILELNRFGDSGGLQIDRRTSRKSHGQSRHIQSLQSLHATTEAQLIAAEQLSENLSKQMSVLNVESPAEKQSIKKELFDTIGLSYDASSYSSPCKEKSPATPLNKQILSTASVATIERSRRDHNSLLAKTHEPETARRRRDSLDRSWVSVAPPRTTVKRIVLQEDQDGLHGNRSPFPLDRQHISTPFPRGMMDNTPSKSSSFPQNQLKFKGIPHFREEHSNQSPSNASTERSNRFPNTMVSKASSHTALPSTASAGQISPETAGLTNGKLGHVFPTKSTGSLMLGEYKPAQQPGQNLHEVQSSSSRLPAQTLVRTKTVMENSDNNTSFSYTKGSDVVGQGSSFTAISSSIVSSIPTSNVHSDSNVPFKVSDVESTNLSQHVEQTSSYTSSLLPDLNSSSLTAIDFPPAHLASSKKQSESMLFHEPVPTSKTSVAVDQSSAESQPLVSSTLTFPTTFSFLTPKTLVSSTSVGQPNDMSSSKSELFPVAKTSLASEPSHSPSDASESSGIGTAATPVASGSIRAIFNSSDVSGPQKDEGSVTQASSTNARGNGFTTITSTQQSEVFPAIAGADKVSDSSPAAMEQGTSIRSSGEVNSGGTMSPIPEMLSNAKAPAPLNVGIPSSKEFSNSGSISSSNNVVSHVVTHEDEMEEEAPERSQASELSLGFLGGFGIGSTVNPKSEHAKPNPFGLQNINAATPTSSTYTLPASGGELFRPPSFSFSSIQPAQPSQSTGFGAFPGGFNGGAAGQLSPVSGFGQPSQIGSGQQALGSVLGSFGQSRQLGAGLPVTGIASPGGFASNSPSGFGSGFGGVSSTSGGFSSLASVGGGGGFSNLASGVGGFAAAASSPGGFAAAASSFGGFAAAATSPGGFASAGGGFAAAATAPGGFAAAATAPGGFASTGGGFAAAASGASFASPTNGAAFPGGFGAFGGQQLGGGFSAFSGSSGTGRPPSELFTQIRK